MSAATGEPLGTAAEEAARLLELLHGWFDARAGAASGLSDEPKMAGGPQPTGAPGTASAPSGHHRACRACPLCRGLAYLQESHPDVLTHLTDAATHLVAAVRSLTEAGPDTAACHSDARGQEAAKHQGPPSRAVQIDVQPEPGVENGSPGQMDSEPREPNTVPNAAGQRANSASEQESTP